MSWQAHFPTVSSEEINTFAGDKCLATHCCKYSSNSLVNTVRNFLEKCTQGWQSAWNSLFDSFPKQKVGLINKKYLDKCF